MMVRSRTSPDCRRLRVLGRRMLAAVVFGILASTSLRAQTDYYNTSAGRPLRVEDALPVEYRGVELNIAPLRWESARNSTYRWSVEPEIAVGILPRTQLQIGVPFAFVDGPSSSTRGVAGLELAALHALNAETSIPALAVAADVLLPVGSLGPDAAYGTFKGILTRTYRIARIHANAQVTAGPTPDSIDTEAVDVEASRWLAGIAVDKTFPLRSILLSLEGFAEQPLTSSAPVAWTAGAGARVQLSPRWAFDAGVGRRLTGDDQAWYVTFGSAYALGIP